MPLKPAQLDAYAQQLGFKDYSQWAAWNQHQQMMRQPQPQAPAQPVAPAGQPAPTNWLQTLIDQTPLGGAMKKIRGVM